MLPHRSDRPTATTGWGMSGSSASAAITTEDTAAITAASTTAVTVAAATATEGAATTARSTRHIAQGVRLGFPSRKEQGAKEPDEYAQGSHDEPAARPRSVLRVRV